MRTGAVKNEWRWRGMSWRALLVWSVVVVGAWMLVVSAVLDRMTPGATTHRRTAADDAALAAEMRAAEVRGQQMERNTIDYLDGLVSTRSTGAGGLTDVQRRANWKTVEGQWVRWRGVVVAVNAKTLTDEMVLVSLRVGPRTTWSDCHFDIAPALGLRLNKGQQVTVEGRLDDHGSSGYYLTDALVLGVR